MKLQRSADGYYRLEAPDPQLEVILDRQYMRTAGKLEWKDPSWRGLGDVVKAVTDKLGIRQCGGCAQRQDALNKLVPFRPLQGPGTSAIIGDGGKQ